MNLYKSDFKKIEVIFNICFYLNFETRLFIFFLFYYQRTKLSSKTKYSFTFIQRNYEKIKIKSEIMEFEIIIFSMNLQTKKKNNSFLLHIFSKELICNNYEGIIVII